jgi:lipid-A-disaccharide synthase
LADNLFAVFDKCLYDKGLTTMAENDKTYRVFISAAEPSADLHCAGLIKALAGRGYDIKFVGVGGEKMAEAGCELLETTVGRAAMIYNALAQVLHFYKLIRKIRAYLQKEKVDLVIVCDSPSFNFHIAKAAKAAGIKTLFYVAPQLWAWAEWRIKKMHKWCDKLAVILPFEEEWFRQRGVEGIFVGNPLLDGINGDFVKDYADFKPQSAKIGIMPGSRAAEIETLWVPMQRVAIRLKKKYPGISFTTVAVDSKRREILKSMQVPGFTSTYKIGTVAETAAQCDFSLVASGSATLQVAAAGCPMVIMYQSSKFLWHAVGRWLIKTRYLSLVNILAQSELVPEFMPYFESEKPIGDAVERLLEDRAALAQTSRELVKLTEPLRGGNSAQKAGDIVLEMLQ